MNKYVIRKRIYIGIVFLLMLTLIFPPIFNLFNKVEPIILGLPFIIFWIFCINVMIAVILILLRINDKKLYAKEEENAK